MDVIMGGAKRQKQSTRAREPSAEVARALTEGKHTGGAKCPETTPVIGTQETVWVCRAWSCAARARGSMEFCGFETCSPVAASTK